MTPSKDRKLMMEMAIKPPTQAVKTEQRKITPSINFEGQAFEE
jgi:hypothetical protein